MLKQIITLFEPTRYKITAAIGFTLAYLVAAFVRIASAGLLLSPSNTQPPSRILLTIVNWIVLAALLYITSYFIFSKKKLLEYSLKQRDVLVPVTIIGLLLSHLFFEMPRFLSSIFTSLANSGGMGSFILIVAADLLLSYVLFSGLIYFIGKLKQR